MILWIAFALLTAGAVAALLIPLARPAAPKLARAPNAQAVYRHQLNEIDDERARGLLDAAEADAAKIEVSRRLLASSAREAAEAPGTVRQTGVAQYAAMATALFVPLLTLALYLAYGSPFLPSFPHAAQANLSPAEAGLGQLVARVEARLREHPEDGDGWDVIAPAYLRLGSYREAAQAYARAAQLKGETVKRLAGFAEATVFAADGVISEDARRAYEKVLQLEPGQIEARFWLAMAKEQDGKLAQALADYQALLAGAPADAAWREPLAARIAEVSRRIAGNDKTPAPGPTAADFTAAAGLSPQQRAAMINEMVDTLAQRLKRDGKDLAGWRRLVHAYVVLNRKDEARSALAEARKNFDSDANALGELSSLAISLGLGS